MDRAIIVGVNTDGSSEYEHSMEELASLVEAAEMEVVDSIVQNMPAIHKSLYVGTGKVRELRDLADMLGVDILIFNDSLTPSQLRNLQNETGVAVMDRTTLILEIFGRRAKTREAILQVEVARLQYLLPRLVGLHDALSRQGGTSGSQSSRGAGEKKLELDRRRLTDRLHELQRELKDMESDKETQMKRRKKSGIPRVALVGYTNAGKSTIMNAMLDLYCTDENKEERKVLQKDMLFATLDTTVRNITPKDNKTILLSDTVGFIDKLPHGLVDAFRSTLAEAVHADLILEVVDFSDPHYKDHMRVTEHTLQEIGAGEIPVFYVFNKADLVEAEPYVGQPGYGLPKVFNDCIYMSAGQRVGMEELVDSILKQVYADTQVLDLMLPYTRGDLYSYLQEKAHVLDTAYEAEGIRVKAEVGQADANRLASFRLTD